MQNHFKGCETIEQLHPQGTCARLLLIKDSVLWYFKDQQLHCSI